ncbi:MAG TPA: hypothetical protein VHX68_00575, partial [Planctomycetaceae bacterium]|nr:hypothetical protein [Planctomycetaceae bacterium]
TKFARGFIRYTAPARPGALLGVIDRARKAEEWATTGGGPSTAGESPGWSVREHALTTIVLCNLALFGAGAVYFAWRRR